MPATRARAKTCQISMTPAQGEHEQRRRLEHRHAVDDEQGPRLSSRSARTPPSGRDEHRRAEEEGHHQPQLERRSAEVEHEPRQRDRLHPGADQAADLAEPVAPVVGMAHRGESASETGAARNIAQRKRMPGGAADERNRADDATRQAGDRHSLAMLTSFRTTRTTIGVARIGRSRASADRGIMGATRRVLRQARVIPTRGPDRGTTLRPAVSRSPSRRLPDARRASWCPGPRRLRPPARDATPSRRAGGRTHAAIVFGRARRDALFDSPPPSMRPARPPGRSTPRSRWFVMGAWCGPAGAASADGARS